MSEVILDTIPVVIGAVIGFGASIATVVIERLLDRHGKISIFYRITYMKGTNGETWGFDSENGKLCFSLPIEFEFQNTSNRIRVIRDVSVVLYYGEKEVKKMVQIESVSTTSRKGDSVQKEEEFFGTGKGSYSFVLQPRSIQPQKCEYLLSIHNNELQEMKFDRIKLQYYDENNKKHIGCMRSVDNCWKTQKFDVDEDWVLLKTKKANGK